MNKSTLTATLIAIIFVMAVLASASAPKLMSYQGRATEASGNPVPDGTYSVQFDLYHYPETGISLWQEVASVTTKDGLFSHTLGSVVPILESQFHYNEELYLQVTFDGEILTPRTQLTSAGFAFHVHSINRSEGGIIRGDIAMYNAIADNEIAELYGDANGEPVLNLNGTERNIALNTGIGGSSSVVLPESAIQASEILDEPGLVYNVISHLPDGLQLNSALFQDIVTDTITIPSPGYIIVLGKTNVEPSNGPYTIQIDETEGGHISTTANISATRAVDDDHATFAYCQNVYFKSMAGTYTFRLEGGSTSADVYASRASLLAVFVPTSYGSVISLMSSQDASVFEDTEAVADENGGALYRVDLRDLELRAAKAEAEAERARADAEKAQRELIRAKYKSSEGQNR